MDRLRLGVAVVGLAMLLAGCASAVGDADVGPIPAAASTPAQTLMWDRSTHRRSTKARSWQNGLDDRQGDQPGSLALFLTAAGCRRVPALCITRLPVDQPLPVALRGRLVVAPPLRERKTVMNPRDRVRFHR